jgi:hypothetical protein
VGTFGTACHFLSVGFAWTMMTQTFAQIYFPPLHAIKNLANSATMAAKTPLKLLLNNLDFG